jgi:histidyl-tRNA synthetase
MSDKKPKKPQKLRARLPRGLSDRGPAEIAATRRMMETIREVYERYGFEPVETPAIEYTDALGKFLPDQDRPNEGVFSFQDDDEQWLSLRYDLTAPLARYVAENFDALPKPYRSYRFGWVFRNEKPGPGRFRQFMQFDADTVGGAGSGSPAAAADAEICMMAADTMEALGFEPGQYVVKVNNRKVLDGVLESIGVTDEQQKLAVLRAIDKLDRLGPDGVRLLLGPGRKDESGDFTKGAALNQDQIGQVFVNLFNRSSWGSVRADTVLPTDDELIVAKEVLFPDWRTTSIPNLADAHFYDNRQLIDGWSQDFLQTKSGGEAHREMLDILDILQSCGYGSRRVRVSLDTVRGLEYYTGPVFEVELLLETKDEKGRPIRFGSVGGGGRYDGLVSRFRGEPVPATGFSIGVSRLQAALQLIGKSDSGQQFGPVVVTVFDKDRLADYQTFVAALRAEKIRAELYLGNPRNMGNQLKYADRRNSPCVIIQGSDEKARGEVQIKDLIEGARAAAAIASNQEWRETRPAQFSCREDEIVAKVREVLARHNVRWG